MTATTTPADITIHRAGTHTDLPTFLATAQPGDTYTEEKNRRITRYTFIERRDGAYSDGADSDRTLGGLVNTLTSAHHGKASYIGESSREYTYTTTSSTLEHHALRDTETGQLYGVRINIDLRTPTYLVHRTDGAKRYSAARLAQHHQQALALA